MPRPREAIKIEHVGMLGSQDSIVQFDLNRLFFFMKKYRFEETGLCPIENSNPSLPRSVGRATSSHHPVISTAEKGQWSSASHHGLPTLLFLYF